MALLPIETRKEYFKKLGYGEYNKKSIRKMQSNYFIRAIDIDGIYGKDTDILLRHI